MTAYYNEIDPYAAQWLRNLIAAGHIAPGVVDERDIRDILPSDLEPYTQCHFFAGIGVWSAALRASGWSDTRPVWTGSCPCQPFSAAGKGGGFDDERHLWPAFFHLISARRPANIFGEQVASKDGYAWLDLVQTDLEGLAYSTGAAVFPAAGVGAPQIRHRTYWLADAAEPGRGTWRAGEPSNGGGAPQLERLCDASRLASPDEGQCGRLTGSSGSEPHRQTAGRQQGDGGASSDCEAGRLADAERERVRACGQGSAGEAPRGVQGAEEQRQWLRADAGSGYDGLGTRPSPVNGFWRDPDWLYCRDDRWRPVEPGTFPLAHGAASRVGRLRAYGNAICLPQAQAFIEAYLETRNSRFLLTPLPKIDNVN
jgi:DNA (cytosine-5)-methyltransferase 1